MTSTVELSPDIQALCDEYQAIVDAAHASQPKQKSRVPEDVLRDLCVLYTQKRDTFVKGRQASGIEDVWMAAEEAYVGIDDANRHEYRTAKWCKPMTKEGPVQKELQPDQKDIRSTVFVRLTARYVDAGAAKLAEILLPPDDKAFSIEPTPDPELIAQQKSDAQVVDPETGQPLERDPRPEEVASAVASPPIPSPLAAPGPVAPPPSGVPGMPGVPPAPGMDLAKMPGVPLKEKDLAQERMEKAKDAAEKAETKIYDWMVECKYTREARKIIFDSAKLGVGVLKGPFPIVQKVRAVSREGGRYTIRMVEKIVPCLKRISPWDFYPDPNCGENIHAGSAIFERDLISERQLAALKKDPSYLADQIDQAIIEGPSKKYVDDHREVTTLTDERYEIWHVSSVLSREDMLSLNALRRDIDREQGDGELPEEMPEISVSLTMVNDRIIKAVPSHLDSERFTYNVMSWQRREGHWAGVGIAEQGSAPQRIVNAATRAMLNNAGKAAGGQIVMDREAVEPADGQWTLLGDKLWYKGAECDDVRKAFGLFTFPNFQEPLMNIINYGMRLMEESTNIPLITQGQSGDTTPETLGATELQNNNANQLLRSIGYTYDDDINGPVVDHLYEWLLLDPDVDDDCKGDYKINAHGSASLVERHIQNQFLATLANAAVNPAYGMDPKKWSDEILKANRYDPRKLKYSKEEQEKIDKTPPPPPPQVQAAQIRAQVDQQKAQLDAQTRTEIAARDTDRDKAYVEAETERTTNEHQARMVELNLKRELAMLDYANKREMTLEQVKADLAMNTQKLQVQRELSEKDRAAEVLKPPTEPEGRAPVGQSWEK